MQSPPRENNGSPEHHINGETEQHNDHGASTPPASEPPQNTDQALHNGYSEKEDAGDRTAEEDNEAPPSKKRKLADSATRPSSTPRPISPPWKKIAVEGPTSFIEEGRRKSSRTNFVPPDLQPLADKRKTRGTPHSPPVSKSKYGGASIYKSSPLVTSPR